MYGRSIRGCLVVSVALAACGKDKGEETATPEPEPERTFKAKSGAPPEDLPAGEWEERKAQIEEAARKAAAEPPPKIDIVWPAAVETDAVDFNGWRFLIKAPIDFNTSNDVTERSNDVVDDIVFVLQETPRITKVEVQSHIGTGAVEFDRDVTLARAQSLRLDLISKGVDEKRIVATGPGITMPIETNRTEAGRRANERVDVVVLEIDGKPLPDR